MEPNTELNPEPAPIPETDFEKEATGEALTEPAAAESSEPLPEGRANLEICPNCLEPNDDDLAVCRYCGMPLHPESETDPAVMPEDEETLARTRAEAVPEKREEKKPQESGFRRVMPWLGLYLIYYAVTGCFDVKRQIQQAVEEGQQVNSALAYLSQGIWFLAGIMMAWPLIKKGWNRIHPSPEKYEETGPAGEDSGDVDPEGADDDGADPEIGLSAPETVQETESEDAADEAEPEDKNE